MDQSGKIFRSLWYLNPGARISIWIGGWDWAVWLWRKWPWTFILGFIMPSPVRWLFVLLHNVMGELLTKLSVSLSTVMLNCLFFRSGTPLRNYWKLGTLSTKYCMYTHIHTYRHTNLNIVVGGSWPVNASPCNLESKDPGFIAPALEGGSWPVLSSASPTAAWLCSDFMV